MISQDRGPVCCVSENWAGEAGVRFCGSELSFTLLNTMVERPWMWQGGRFWRFNIYFTPPNPVLTRSNIVLQAYRSTNTAQETFPSWIFSKLTLLQQKRQMSHQYFRDGSSFCYFVQRLLHCSSLSASVREHPPSSSTRV